MTAMVFDLPHVVQGAAGVLAAGGVADRGEGVGGDFFDSVPAGGDAYVLSMILHDWDDAATLAILENVRCAMSPAGKVLVIDAVLPEGDVPHFGKLTDIVMLSLLTGRERTEAEFSALLAAAGLRHTETQAASAPTGVIVGVLT